jgi:hypothetical protein
VEYVCGREAAHSGVWFVRYADIQSRFADLPAGLCEVVDMVVVHADEVDGTRPGDRNICVEVNELPSATATAKETRMGI